MYPDHYVTDLPEAQLFDRLEVRIQRNIKLKLATSKNLLNFLLEKLKSPSSSSSKSINNK